ncbi:MAG: sigma-70 family RNA polymerase sigma factor, partial [Kiritimatiellia bacterium]
HWVLECLRHLSVPEQQIMVLRLQEGLSYREISRITGRTEGNVGCILHHAVKKVSTKLKKAGIINGGSL